MFHKRKTKQQLKEQIQYQWLVVKECQKTFRMALKDFHNENDWNIKDTLAEDMNIIYQWKRKHLKIIKKLRRKFYKGDY